MRMIESLHKFDFSSNGLFPLDLFHLFFQIDFKGDFFIGLFVHANIDSRISTLPNLLANNVVVKGSFR
jgi:hypothetical protein